MNLTVENQIRTLQRALDEPSIPEPVKEDFKRSIAFLQDIVNNPYVDIAAELSAAKAKHPTWSDNLAERACIITEELGEMAEAVNELLALDHKPTYNEIDLDREKLRDAVRGECIQVAATAVRFLQEFDSSPKLWPSNGHAVMNPDPQTQVE